MRLLISAMEKKLEKIYLGGGKTRIAKTHEQGKMTARERINFLIDKDSKTIEIGAFAGDDMYKEHGGCPAGGVVDELQQSYEIGIKVIKIGKCCLYGLS